MWDIGIFRGSAFKTLRLRRLRAARLAGAASLRLRARVLAWLPAPLLGCGYGALLMLALVLSGGSEQAFIYFQF